MMSILAGRRRLNGGPDLGLSGKLADPKVAICRAFCRRMVDETGKGGPQLLAAWPQERAEVRWFAGLPLIAVRSRMGALRRPERHPVCQSWLSRPMVRRGSPGADPVVAGSSGRSASWSG